MLGIAGRIESWSRKFSHKTLELDFVEYFTVEVFRAFLSDALRMTSFD
jgi:hypothetical protein